MTQIFVYGISNSTNNLRIKINLSNCNTFFENFWPRLKNRKTYLEEMTLIILNLIIINIFLDVIQKSNQFFFYKQGNNTFIQLNPFQSLGQST